MLAQAAARGLHMAGSFTLFGTLLIAAFLLPAAAAAQLRRRLARLAWASFALLIIAGAAWFVLQSADMSGATDLADLETAIPIVAGATRFGQLLIGRCAAAAIAILLFQFGRKKPAAILAGGAVIAESWLGHGGAMTGRVGGILLAASICHLAAGAAWLGALPALRLALKHLPIQDAAAAARDFSPLGIAWVAGLVVSAAVQSVFLIGSPAALVDSEYGLTASFKLLALIGLITLAAINRNRLTPALAAAGEPARAQLLRTVTAEIVIGVAILLAAGLLLQLAPPAMIHP